MRGSIFIGAFLFLFAASLSLGQGSANYDVTGTASHAPLPLARLEEPVLPPGSAAPALTVPVPSVRMSPELALNTYLGNANRQLANLGACSDVMTVEADLPDTLQHGKFELRRYYQAPRSLAFASLHFVGDSFVKTNVITRLLQSEMDHVQKGEGPKTAITADNYKFSFKGAEDRDGRVLYIYHVKPKHKREGLFKGRIAVDAATGRLRRAEGTMVKSPSLFVKKIDFVQEYGDFGPFSLPLHIHSEARTRLVGRAVVEISHTDYRMVTVAELQASSASNGGGSSSN